MTEPRGAPPEVLLQRPWLPVSIGGCQLLVKTWFGDTAYHILLTDVQCVWEERMDSAAIQQRAQDLNRRLRAPVEAFFSHLCDVVQPRLTGSAELRGGDAHISATRQEDGNISMKLKSELAGLPFYWEFHCTPAPVTVVCVQLVRPLLVMSQLLQQQVEQLGGLLGRKDAEILDYRENGATLSRERLQTAVFEEQTYRDDFMSKALPLLCSEQTDAVGFDVELRRLYATVVAQRNTRKRQVCEERSVEEEEAPPAARADDSSSSGGSVVSDAGEGGQLIAAGAKMAAAPTATQSAAVRPSKPKKKKVVGLFR